MRVLITVEHATMTNQGSNHTQPATAESSAVDAYTAHVRDCIERHAAANPGNPHATLHAAGAELGLDRDAVDFVIESIQTSNAPNVVGNMVVSCKLWGAKS
jgi:hypothetical protein